MKIAMSVSAGNNHLMQTNDEALLRAQLLVAGVWPLVEAELFKAYNTGLKDGLGRAARTVRELDGPPYLAVAFERFIALLPEGDLPEARAD